MKKTPLAQVKERFESKEKLVAAVRKLATDALWTDRVNDEKGLEKVSNAKLLRLHDLLETSKKEFGSRDKLIDAILTAEKRQKDAGFRTRLEQYPLPRLLDMVRASGLRSKRAAAKAKAAAAKPAAKKPAKKAAKKTAAKKKSATA